MGSIDVLKGDDPPIRQYFAEATANGEAGSDVPPVEDPYLLRGERCLFVAIEGGRAVGRLATFWDRRSCDVLGGHTGFFSHFDAVDDFHVVHELFAAAWSWLSDRGVVKALGPFSPKITDPRGIQVEDGEATCLKTIPERYGRLLASVGCVPAKDILEYLITIQPYYKRLDRVVAIAKSRYPDVRTRYLDFAEIERDAYYLVDIYNRAWCANWAFVPLDANDFVALGAVAGEALRPEYVAFVEIAGRPVGVVVVLPDDLTSQIRGSRPSTTSRAPKQILRAQLIGVLPEYRNSGIDALLIAHVLDRVVRAREARQLHIGWVLEDNRRWRRAIENLASPNYTVKRYRIFEGRRGAWSA